MAHSEDNLGLNEVARLHEDKTMDSSEKKSGLSRIPKLQFSFRRNNHTLAPEEKQTVSKSAPNSNESSPTLGRSKSLRLPRSTYIAKSHSSSALDRDRERQSLRQQQHRSGAHQDSNAHPSPESTSPPQTSYLKPRGFSRSGSSSSPSSRHSSPGFSGGSGDGGGYNLSQGDGGSSTPLQEFGYDEPSHFQRRTKSFSATRYTSAQTNSYTSRERGVLRPSSAGRSKTPTGTSRITAPPPSSGHNASSRKFSHARTNSVGQVAERTPNGNATPNSQQKLPVRRTGSSGYSSGSSGGRRGSNGSRGRRPSSIIIADGTADLNKLAKEISNSFSPSGMVDATSVEVETKSTSKIQTFSRIPTTKRSKSPLDRNTTPSPVERSALTSSSKSYDLPSSSSSSRTRYMTPKMRSLSVEKMNAIRPNSARAFYNGGVPTADTQRPELQRPRSSAGTDHPDSNPNRRSSTPGGELGGPAHRGSGTKSTLMTPRQMSPTPESGSATVKVAGLPPRTPYRVAKTRGVPWTGPAGINELEGAVLLEADDYRRISNEVKSLKTALLKLKRELQADSQATPSTTTTSTRVSYRTISSSALTKKSEQIAAERDKEAQEEIAKLKKENALKVARIEQLTSELKQANTEKQELGDKLQQMEAHRDYLLDKVERLHADKHKLEDKLNSQDKARLYERTLSTNAVMVDLDVEEMNSFEESLEVCGGKLGERKETESDIGDSLMLSDGEGESSEPESAAVCSTPIS